MKPIRSSLIVSVLVISLLGGCNHSENNSQNNNSNKSQNLPKIEDVNDNFSKVNKELSNLRDELLKADTKPKIEEIKSSLSSLSFDTLNQELKALNESLKNQSLKNKLPYTESNSNNDLSQKLTQLQQETDISKLKEIISEIQTEVNNIDDQIYNAQIKILNELAKSPTDKPIENSPNNLIAQIFMILLLLVIFGLNVFQFDESHRRRRLSKDNLFSSEDKDSLFQQLNQLQNQLSEISSNISIVRDENSIATVKSQSHEILSNFSNKTLEFLNNFSNIMTSLFDKTSIDRASLKSNIHQDDNVNTSELNNKFKVIELLISQLREIIDTLRTSKHDPSYNFQETNNLIRHLINDLSNFSSSDQTNQKIIIDRLQDEVESLREEKTNLNNQIEDFEKKQQKWTTYYEKMKSDITNLQSQLQEKDQWINYYQSQLGQIQQERDNLQSESQQQEEEASQGESSTSELDSLVRLFNQDPQSLKNQESFVEEVSMSGDDFNKLRDGETQDVIFKNLSYNDPYLILRVNQTYYLFFRDNFINSYNDFIAKYAFDSNLRPFPKKSFQLIKPAKLQLIDNNKWQVIEKGELYFLG